MGTIFRKSYCGLVIGLFNGCIRCLIQVYYVYGADDIHVPDVRKNSRMLDYTKIPDIVLYWMLDYTIIPDVGLS